MRDVNRAMHTQKKSGLHEVLPKAGLVVSEKGNLTEILCKPKILPLKSITLQKLEEMEVGTASACMHASACASCAAYVQQTCTASACAVPRHATGTSAQPVLLLHHVAGQGGGAQQEAAGAAGAALG